MTLASEQLEVLGRVVVWDTHDTHKHLLAAIFSFPSLIVTQAQPANQCSVPKFFFDPFFSGLGTRPFVCQK